MFYNSALRILRFQTADRGSKNPQSSKGFNYRTKFRDLTVQFFGAGARRFDHVGGGAADEVLIGEAFFQTSAFVDQFVQLFFEARALLVEIDQPFERDRDFGGPDDGARRALLGGESIDYLQLLDRRQPFDVVSHPRDQVARGCVGGRDLRLQWDRTRDVERRTDVAQPCDHLDDQRHLAFGALVYLSRIARCEFRQADGLAFMRQPPPQLLGN